MMIRFNKKGTGEYRRFLTYGHSIESHPRVISDVLEGEIEDLSPGDYCILVLPTHRVKNMVHYGNDETREVFNRAVEHGLIWE